ncbi:TPA: hypothetical protein R2K55_000627 [Raoultella ornithinolytica]|uniref:hypothetical protein n=1 Tax=Raoultella ornithinolytica TaxID=54291 RepID=UPI00273E6A44|nr:hypothetical protein [Raoultella ornithinolytica]WLP46918.1 hypothetical protein Q7A27_03735 [Raoultella ornithinolytica]HEC2549203.1 hypothetical protein [Raoultella ornithinolytica]HEC2601746.1 hypothetical protein [Raoultella ornithinolytica]HEC2608344.1 hypothetical protein [Raoultella ornithinolytica]
MEFTKEQLIEHLRSRIEHRKGLIASIHIDRGYRDYLKLELRSSEIALASLEAEAVCVIDQSNLDYLKSGSDADVWPASRAEMGDVLLYRSATPAPVSVPDTLADDIDSDDHPLLWSYNNGWNACRAAMLQGAEPVTTTYKSPDDFICMLTGRAKYLREKGEFKSPELLERAAAALQEESVNTPPIPNGWKLVPIDPTKDMLRAGQSVVGFWLNTVHCYSKMLAAAPAAPQQEVESQIRKGKTVAREEWELGARLTKHRFKP